MLNIKPVCYRHSLMGQGQLWLLPKNKHDIYNVFAMNTLNRARHMKNRFTAKLDDFKQSPMGGLELWFLKILEHQIATIFIRKPPGTLTDLISKCTCLQDFTRTIAMHKFHHSPLRSSTASWATNRRQVHPAPTPVRNVPEPEATVSSLTKSATRTLQEWWILSWVTAGEILLKIWQGFWPGTIMVASKGGGQWPRLHPKWRC